MKIIETCIYGENLEEMEKFYREVFGLKVYSKKENAFVFFKCENGMLLIFNPKYTSKNEDIPKHGCEGSCHIAFSIGKEEVSYWKRKLENKGISIERIYTWSNGGVSIYFRDPAGNSVELITSDTWGF